MVAVCLQGGKKKDRDIRTPSGEEIILRRGSLKQLPVLLLDDFACVNNERLIKSCSLFLDESKFVRNRV